MAINDMINGNFDADAARYDRMNRTQPAEFAPGQDAIFQSQDVFAQSAVQNNTSQMGDIFSTGIDSSAGMGYSGFDPNNSFATGMNSPMGIPSGNSMQQQPMQQQKTQEDMFYDAIRSGAKGSFDVMKELAESFSSLTPRWYSEWGRIVTMTGGVVALVGIITKIFGYSNGLKLTIGGLGASVGGILIWLLLTDKARNYTSKYKDENNTNQSFNQPSEVMPTSVGFDVGMDFSGNDFNSNNSDLDGFDDDDFSSFSDPDGFDDDDDIYGFDNNEYIEEDQAEDGVNMEDALSNMQDIPAGMFTRQYLWDMFSQVLPTMKPSFSSMREVDEADDAFLYWGEKLREAAAVAGCKEDCLPDLLRLQENLFTIIVTCDRPQGFKPESVASELSNIYAYSDGEKNENVFAKVDTIGAECRITIFNGAAAMISLKDMMLEKKDFMLDTKNYMPVCLGVDQLGKVLTVDFKKLESVIITGMPRSGKSWFVQAVLTQMCAFVPPSQLNIYICDPKEGISDFKAFTLPHVKKFVSGDDNIVTALRNIVKVEAPRRKKIIGDAGFVNIWDYKERYPDINLPIVYVVIDEVVTLAERMEKETKKEFQGLLVELISQLPALGIRAFLIPHVIKNDIIAKTATDLVPCKISVCGDANHIETVTGAKFKEFPYKLVNKGDMAVKLSGIQGVQYIHGPALTDSNPKNNQLFDYMRRVWLKLEPDEASSISDNADIEMANNKALNEMSDMSEDTQVWTNSNENGLSGMVDGLSADDLNLF